jgi:hypothetical protein
MGTGRHPDYVLAVDPCRGDPCGRPHTGDPGGRPYTGNPGGRPPVRASASGKVILLGEHAVVYGRPAIAVPLSGLRATAILTPHPGPLRVQAPAVGIDAPLPDLPPDHPLARIVHLTVEHLRQTSAGCPPADRVRHPRRFGAGVGGGGLHRHRPRAGGLVRRSAGPADRLRAGVRGGAHLPRHPQRDR